MRPAPFVLAVVVLSLSVAGFAAYRAMYDPDVAMLVAENGASWIREDAPFSLRVRKLGEYTTNFRTTFDVGDAPSEAVLTLRAFKSAIVVVNGVTVLDAGDDLTTWRIRHQIDIASALRSGPNEILISVSNENGPRLALAHCESPGLKTDSTWEAANSEGEWKPAALARDTGRSDLTERFPRPWTALLRVSPWLVMVAFLAFFATLRADRELEDGTIRRYFHPRRVRLCLLGGWGILAANNYSKIPYYVGLDIEGHLNYINHMWLFRHIPLADDGWQMFQAPLYYLVSEPFYVLLNKYYHLIPDVVQILRFIPLACGALHVEWSYRAARAIWPERRDLQNTAMALGGFLPMSLYMSQYIGNEPMAATATGLVVVIALALLTKGVTNARCAALGSALGVAILTKITALFVSPALLLVLVLASSDEMGGRKRAIAAARSAAIVFGVAALISGWYFVRNQVELGVPVVGASANIEWWQDPGYRTPEQFYRFGEALIRPVNAGTQGFWDSMYSTMWLDGTLSSMVEYDSRPPWNENFMLAGAWLGAIPMAAIVFGCLFAWKRLDTARDKACFVCAVAVLSYLGAALYLYVTLPIYSVGKATYLLGLAPCLAVLACRTLERPMSARIGRAACAASIAAYATAAYAAYFVF